EKYFTRLSNKANPEPVETVEPEQQGERRIFVEDPAQPLLLVGYHMPDFNHPDRIVADVLLDVAGRGRASRLYKNLVKQKRIAISTSGFSGFPGTKYPSLITFFAFPSRGHSTEECEAALYEEIDNLKKQLVSEEELKKAKTRARADLIRQLGSNTGIAGQLAFYEAMTGDWRDLFRELDRINAVTAQDIQRVAQQYLTPKHRTVAVTRTTAATKTESTPGRQE
ncbi:MAG TPA: insulinase family protein, partial [Acidobacteriota bacterium]